MTMHAYLVLTTAVQCLKYRGIWTRIFFYVGGLDDHYATPSGHKCLKVSFYKKPYVFINLGLLCIVFINKKICEYHPRQ
jgi:hypothetical protein